MDAWMTHSILSSPEDDVQELVKESIYIYIYADSALCEGPHAASSSEYIFFTSSIESPQKKKYSNVLATLHYSALQDVVLSVSMPPPVPGAWALTGGGVLTIHDPS